MKHLFVLVVCLGFVGLLFAKAEAELISSGEITDFAGIPIDPTVLNNAVFPFNAAIGFNAVGSITQDSTAGGNGIAATNTDRTRIAHNAGSDGTLTLDGFGVSWGARFTNVGQGGTGALNVLNGARYDARDDIYIGSSIGAIGVANITGIASVLTAGDPLVVGLSGNGTLNVTAGGRVSVQLDDIHIGENAGSSGHLIVSGANSVVDTPWDVWVGNGGSGTLEVRNGGTIGSSLNSTGRIGNLSGSNGEVLVTDLNSTWNVEGSFLAIGDEGNGTLNLARGGKVSVTNDGLLGRNLTGVGTLAFTIGDDGTGSIASGLLEVGGQFDVGNGFGFFEIAVDNPLGLSVGNAFTLVDYDTYSGDLLLVNDGMSVSPLVDGGSYTTANGVIFSIDYDADLDGMGDLGVTATVTEIALVPEPATSVMLLCGVVIAAVRWRL